MTTLVTGGTGLIGSAVAEVLEARGEPTVLFDLDAGEDPAAVTLATGDVATYGDLAAVVDDHRPDRIAHLAAIIGTEPTAADPTRALQVNGLGTDHVLRVAREHDVDRVVLASTLGVYGPAGGYPTDAVSESTAVPAALNDADGFSFYRAIKQLNEYQAQLYRAEHGVDARVIRPSVAFGPKRDRQWLGRVIDDALHDGAATVERPPADEFSLVYMLDVAELFAAVLLTDRPEHHVYNTGGTTTSARAFARLVADATGGTVTCDDTAPPKPSPPVIENRRAVEEFGYSVTPLADAVADYVDRIS